MTEAFLLTGSNLGHSFEMLQRAEVLIHAQAGKIILKSEVYQSNAWGKTDQPAFLNQALYIQTALSAHELLHTVLNIEKQLGRLRYVKWGPRLIDIDILFYGNEVLSGNLCIPHPLLQDRRFALMPLASIAPEWIHPIFKKTIQQLLANCPDNGIVELYNPLNP